MPSFFMATLREAPAPAPAAPDPAPAATLLAKVAVVPVVLVDPHGPMPIGKLTLAAGPKLAGVGLPAPTVNDNPPKYKLNQRGLVAPGGSGLNGVMTGPGATAPVVTAPGA